jgi:hypothetical protein
MSRHKLVKNLDLIDELDDYDGGEDYDDDGAGGEGLLLLFSSFIRGFLPNVALTNCRQS